MGWRIRRSRPAESSLLTPTSHQTHPLRADPRPCRPWPYQPSVCLWWLGLWLGKQRSSYVRDMLALTPRMWLFQLSLRRHALWCAYHKSGAVTGSGTPPTGPVSCIRRKPVSTRPEQRLRRLTPPPISLPSTGDILVPLSVQVCHCRFMFTRLTGAYPQEYPDLYQWTKHNSKEYCFSIPNQPSVIRDSWERNSFINVRLDKKVSIISHDFDIVFS